VSECVAAPLPQGKAAPALDVETRHHLTGRDVDRAPEANAGGADSVRPDQPAARLLDLAPKLFRPLFAINRVSLQCKKRAAITGADAQLEFCPADLDAE
jgi:hypothetical protein